MTSPVSTPSEEQRGSGFAVVGTSVAGIGAAATAAAASLCCVGPAVVSIVGVSGAVAAAGLKPYRPFLILGSMALLGVAFWLTYQPRTAAGAGAVACPTRAGRMSRRIVWIAAVVWLVAVLLPSIVSLLQ
jgi:mercuric ion transport protein